MPNIHQNLNKYGLYLDMTINISGVWVKHYVVCWRVILGFL
jgi:hypothetical protein